MVETVVGTEVSVVEVPDEVFTDEVKFCTSGLLVVYRNPVCDFMLSLVSSLVNFCEMFK